MSILEHSIKQLDSFLQAILQEDLGRGELFSQILSARDSTAKIISKDSGILAGVPYIKRLSQLQGFDIHFEKEDSDALQPREVIALLSGDSHTLLACERTCLNILQHASGIATLTHAYAEQIKDLPTRLLDTRKTRPLLRQLEKYATRTGGATNHRMGLDDCLMLKDTHLKTIEDIPSFIAEARKKIPFTAKIEMECETLEQAKIAMESNVDIIMCDNMTLEQIKEVVAYRNANHAHVLLECSGGITLDNVRSYAKTGVDALSCGSLIHQATWLDFSMKMD